MEESGEFHLLLLVMLRGGKHLLSSFFYHLDLLIPHVIAMPSRCQFSVGDSQDGGAPDFTFL